MPTTDKFPEALNAALAKVLPDEQSQAAARALQDKHQEKVRAICTQPARMGKRVEQLAAADQELLEALEDLTDTEHDHDEPTPAEPA